MSISKDLLGLDSLDTREFVLCTYQSSRFQDKEEEKKLLN